LVRIKEKGPPSGVNAAQGAFCGVKFGGKRGAVFRGDDTKAVLGIFEPDSRLNRGVVSCFQEAMRTVSHPLDGGLLSLLFCRRADVHILAQPERKRRAVCRVALTVFHFLPACASLAVIMAVAFDGAGGRVFAFGESLAQAVQIKRAAFVQTIGYPLRTSAFAFQAEGSDGF
jgi:hypothetical protein